MANNSDGGGGGDASKNDLERSSKKDDTTKRDVETLKPEALVEQFFKELKSDYNEKEYELFLTQKRIISKFSSFALDVIRMGMRGLMELFDERDKEREIYFRENNANREKSFSEQWKQREDFFKKSLMEIVQIQGIRTNDFSNKLYEEQVSFQRKLYETICDIQPALLEAQILSNSTTTTKDEDCISNFFKKNKNNGGEENYVVNDVLEEEIIEEKKCLPIEKLDICNFLKEKLVDEDKIKKYRMKFLKELRSRKIERWWKDPMNTLIVKNRQSGCNRLFFVESDRSLMEDILSKILKE